MPPENAQFARDLGVSYAKLAQCSEGEVQTAWWQQCHRQFKSMQAQGILAEGDKPLLDYLQQQIDQGG